MAKKTNKVSINLTDEEYKLLELLALKERRTISELAALMVVDTSLSLYRRTQKVGEWRKPTFCPTDFYGEEDGEERTC